MSFNSVKNYCWCGTHHYPRALGKAGIPLPTNPLEEGDCKRGTWALMGTWDMEPREKRREETD